MHKYEVWSQGVARRALAPRSRTGNPTLAAVALLGKKRVRVAERFLRRIVRKRAFRGNPVPALAAGVGGSVLKKLGIGRKFDPKKHPQRLAYVEALGQIARGQRKPEAWAGGSKAAALARLEGIASGQEGHGVAVYDEIRQAAAAQLATVEAEMAAEAEKAAAASDRAAAASQREARFLEAGSSIAGTLGSALLSRGRRLPRRKKRKSRRGQFY